MKERIVERILALLKKISGKAWMRQHEKNLREQMLAILGEEMVTGVDDIIEVRAEFPNSGFVGGATTGRIQSDEPNEAGKPKNTGEQLETSTFYTAEEYNNLKQDFELTSNQLTETVKAKNEVDSQLEAAQAQIIETIDANTELSKEYQAAHGALIQLATLTLGSKEELRTHAPLTTEKLLKLIEYKLSQKPPSAQVEGFNCVEWAENYRKHLVMIGHGPLATGRHEGAADTITQLLAAARVRR